MEKQLSGHLFCGFTQIFKMVLFVLSLLCSEFIFCLLFLFMWLRTTEKVKAAVIFVAGYSVCDVIVLFLCRLATKTTDSQCFRIRRIFNH